MLRRHPVLGVRLAGAAAAQTLTIGTGGSITSLDPHFFNAAPHNALAHRDSRSRPIPGLAESWHAVDELTWEFRLRNGATWHDRRPFTADDVVFSLSRAPTVLNSPSGFGSMLRMGGSPTSRQRHRRISAMPYPYSILYRVSGGEVVIHSIRHTSRKPPGW